MTDSILTPGDRKEGLSRAYVQAVSAVAGYTLAEQNFDRDGVDIQVRAGGTLRPSLDLQLKATARLAQDGPVWRFPLPKRNYDLLRARTMVPRILVVLDLPTDERDWLTLSEERLVLKRCAYWAAITGAPESDNEYTVTVSIPAHHRFDVAGLTDLISLWTKRPAWESVLEEMGNPVVRADAGRFPHRVAARIAGATRSARFRGEGGPSPHPSPAALRAAPAREGLFPQPVMERARKGTLS